MAYGVFGQATGPQTIGSAKKVFGRRGSLIGLATAVFAMGVWAAAQQSILPLLAGGVALAGLLMMFFGAILYMWAVILSGVVAGSVAGWALGFWLTSAHPGFGPVAATILIGLPLGVALGRWLSETFLLTSFVITLVVFGAACGFWLGLGPAIAIPMGIAWGTVGALVVMRNDNREGTFLATAFAIVTIAGVLVIGGGGMAWLTWAAFSSINWLTVALAVIVAASIGGLLGYWAIFVAPFLAGAVPGFGAGFAFFGLDGGLEAGIIGGLILGFVGGMLGMVVFILLLPIVTSAIGSTIVVTSLFIGAGWPGGLDFDLEALMELNAVGGGLVLVLTIIGSISQYRLIHKLGNDSDDGPVSNKRPKQSAQSLRHAALPGANLPRDVTTRSAQTPTASAAETGLVRTARPPVSGTAPTAGRGERIRRLKCPRCGVMVAVPVSVRPMCQRCGYGKKPGGH